MPPAAAGTADLPLLPVPALPGPRLADDGGALVAFTPGHHFALAADADPLTLAESAMAPLSVILQVTKRCDFGCVFCSETLQMGDPALADLETMRDNLAGVQRVFLSGGEPLLRRDLPEIVDLFASFIIGLPTNATRAPATADLLAGKVAFANIGFDGPRATFARVRGDYDKVIGGVRAFTNAGIPISLSAVVLRSTVHALPYLCQIADVIDAGKVKLILPLRKGNALGLAEREFITVEEAREAFAHLIELRAVHDWRPAIRLTPWAWTNMLWPEDPYRTGQQLYRRPGPLLAAFAIRVPASGRGPGAVAVVYLPLNRTRTVTTTEQTLALGFRTAVAADLAEMPDLAAVADLDLLQARRHAAVVAGHAFAAGLAALRQAAGTRPLRGIAAVELDWASRSTQARGSGLMADSADGPLGSPDLADACARAGVRYEHATAGQTLGTAGLDETAAVVTERALAIGLVCAKRLGRYQWQGTLDVWNVLAAAGRDFADHPERTMPQGLPTVARAGGS